jgi:hypothetical protein
MEHKTLVLPVQVVTPTDLGRLIREFEAIDSDLMQQELRDPETKNLQMPKTSKMMDQLVVQNKLNLTHKTDRKLVGDFLTAVKERAPVLHMSFSQDPSVAFMDKLITWLRREIHVQTLVTIGMQPNLGAGCIVRSTNKQFDFSLRQRFENQRGVLADQLSGPAKAAQPEEVATA